MSFISAVLGVQKKFKGANAFRKPGFNKADLSHPNKISILGLFYNIYVKKMKIWKWKGESYPLYRDDNLNILVYYSRHSTVCIFKMCTYILNKNTI